MGLPWDTLYSMATHDPRHAPAAAVHVVARHWARPDTIDEVREILTALVAPSRAEPGCLKYELFQNLADPADFTFVETFASDAALAAHAAAPYITGLQPRLRALTARPSEVCRYRAVQAS
jgi:quinol monooxygenase YgiN